MIITFGNPLEDRVPGKSFSFSDHNAVALETKVRISAFNKPLQTLRQIRTVKTFDETIKQAITVCEEAKANLARSKKFFITSGGLLLMFLIGTVGFWTNYVLYDIIKLIITALCFYCLLMGTLWNKIEMNSLKAGLGSLENFYKTRKVLKNELALRNDLVTNRFSYGR